MKTRYRILISIPALLVCMLFGCEKKETLLLSDWSGKETKTPEVSAEAEGSRAILEQDKAAEGETAGLLTEAGAVLSGNGEGKTSAETGAPGNEGKQPPAEAEAVFLVHICGAVNHPGVYEFLPGSRLYQAVEAAGGFDESADENFLNQAEYLQDGCRIYVPTREEALQAQESGKEENSFISKSENSGFPAGADNTGETGSKSDTRVNINTASREELCTVTGIGSSRAESIIKYRTENGGFRSIEEIMNVEGIKDGMFEKIKEQITV